jgi:hypothetical protein
MLDQSAACGGEQQHRATAERITRVEHLQI